MDILRVALPWAVVLVAAWGLHVSTEGARRRNKRMFDWGILVLLGGLLAWVALLTFYAS